MHVYVLLRRLPWLASMKYRKVIIIVLPHFKEIQIAIGKQSGGSGISDKEVIEDTFCDFFFLFNERAVKCM